MAYPSRLLSHGRLLSHKRPERSPLAPGDRGCDGTFDAASVDDDLALVRQTRANLLVIGSEDLVMSLVHRVIADVPAVIVRPSVEGRLSLSDLWSPYGTLVVRDIDALDAEGQARLSDWLETARPERQIVCTASTCLLPMVEAGAFDSRLYYRLNTVRIDLGPAPH